MKNFVLGASLIAVGIWYVHHAANYSRPGDQDDKDRGSIVVANAPDGTLQARWPGATPTASRSK